MPHNRFYFFFLLLLLPFLLHGKEKNHILAGHLKVKGGDTYQYQLFFDVSHSILKGYSLTKMPDGTETKTSLKGLINKDKHLILFTETKLLTAEQKDFTTCFVNAVLTYKLQGANYVVSGFFKGKDGDQKECGEGTLEFVLPKGTDDLFDADSVNAAKQNKTESDFVAKPERLLDSNTITAGQDRQFNWHSDTCILDIWDGGVIDGDVVSVLVNNKKVLTGYTLEKDKKRLILPIGKKINTITIVAEEEGINPPNTTQMILYDHESQYRITAFNKKGEKAIIILRK